MKLEDYTVKDLKAKLKAMGIGNYSRKSKTEIIKMFPKTKKSIKKKVQKPKKKKQKNIKKFSGKD